MNNATQTDFLVIGAGVIGLNLSRLLKERYPDCKVTLIDKEDKLAAHASGRNSGVLHAGFYYSADSLKARFTRDGNKQLTDYCIDRKLRINRCGKLVVTKNENELPQLDELKRRGDRNGVQLDVISVKEAEEIEPRIKTVERALFSPMTSSIDPMEVMTSMKEDAVRAGVDIRHGTAFMGHNSNNTVKTNGGDISAGYVVNAAGLYADKIALQYGFSEQYRILPFKGLYLYANESSPPLRTNIYPVPDLRNPFLGVHYTITVDGKIKIGPTAIPAFWREQYNGLSKCNPGEMLEILGREFSLFAANHFGFRQLAVSELVKYYKPHLVKLASHLLQGVKVDDYSHWGKPGIRAQLVNIKSKKLEMDFIYEGDDRSFHVLNAVSPAFTCSLPFSEYMLEKMTALMK